MAQQRRRKMISHTTIESPFGPILLTTEDSTLTGLFFHGQRHEPVPGPDWKPDPGSSLFKEAARQLAGYFSGRRRSFRIPLRPRGTPFQEKVWQAITTIPYGATASYRGLAEKIDKPNAVRAVGAAVGRNPISVIIPCHRVIGKDGSLTGYAGGLERKKALLDLEQKT
jgi:methylated-DNA-[protein]-cysteine S-methyltransferase